MISENNNSLGPQEISSIWARDLSASYNGGDLVLTRVDLDIPAGKLTAIVGPNGAGKSTLFNIIVGIKQPLSGELHILGESIEKQSRSNSIAYVPQHENIDWDYPINVWNVVLGGRYGYMRSASGLRKFLPPNWSGRQHQHAVAAALSAVTMLDYRDRPIGALSGGQKKRVFLARALAQEAKILLLDEPLVGIDTKSETLIFQVLEELRTTGITIVMVTHDLASAKRYANHVLLINRTVIKHGPPEEVLSNASLDLLFSNSLTSLPTSGDTIRVKQPIHLTHDKGGY